MIKNHEKDYKENAWNEYTMQELGQWVHLLSTRAQHRANGDKRVKDLYDAQNYLDMMQQRLTELKT